MTGVLESLAISALVSGLSAGITYALTPTQKLEQGRLDSLLPGTVGYGQPIPWAWGTVRLPGQRIWQTKLEETQKKNKQGKGAKVETTEYNYFGNYAEMFCECPFRPIVGYQRYWQNKKLTYSTIGGAETIAEGGKYADRYLRFYKGEAAQAIDPLLSAVDPINNYSYGLPTDKSDRDNYLRSLGLDPNQLILTPGYNYRAYIVAQRLPLADFFNAIPGGEAEIIATRNCTVGQIIGDIMSLFFEPSRYDVSLLTTPVAGFSIDSPTQAKSVIQTLQQAYFFDVVNSANTFKFIPLNHPRDIINLTAADLAAHQSGQEKPLDFEVIETDPTTLPSKVIVSYIDPDKDYDVGEQYSNGEVKEFYNNKPVRLSFNLVLSASEAATIADRAFILAWIKKYTYKFQLPPAYLDLEPTDLIPDLFSDSGNPIKLTQTRLGANLIIECEGEQHDTFFWDFVRVLESGAVTLGVADYNVILEVNGTVNAVSDTSGNIYTEGTDYQIDSNGNVQVLSTGSILEGTDLVVSTTATPTGEPTQIVSAGDTELLILDIPLINNDDADFTFYLVASGGANWSGCSVYISTDNSRYIFTDTIDSYGIHGQAVSVLDNSNQVNVEVNASELESITASDLALGFNYALVGNEIIQFKTAQLIDVNTYQLSEITRGLRGTEEEVNNHAIGDRFVLLTGENASIAKVQATSSDIGQTRYFKAVSTGQTLDEASAQIITYQGIAQRPYSPVNLRATKNAVGDISIEWDRRDRHDQKNPPSILTEDLEEFVVEIKNGNAVIRSFNANNSSAIYTAQNQQSDFGSIQSSITVSIAQVSSSYGNGSFATAQLTPILVEPVPTITGFFPASAQVSATITVTGTDLGTVTVIKCGDIEQNNLAVIDNQTVSFAIAPGTVSASLELTTDGGTAISPTALIIEQPPQALVFPIGAPVTLPYTITPSEAGLELIISAQTATLSIPDSDAGFAAGWGCWISLDGAGTVTIERESGGTSGILGNNAIASDETVKLWHRGGNVWKID